MNEPTNDKKYEDKLFEILQKDEQFQLICTILCSLQRSNLYLAGGVVRNTVWNAIFGISSPPDFNDIDIVYIDNASVSVNIEKEIEQQLCKKSNAFNWSVKNQTRMAQKHGHSTYPNLEMALSHWIETATAIAVHPKLEKRDFIAPFGLIDLLSGVVKPSHPSLEIVMQNRIAEKNWKRLYPKLTYF